MLLSLWPPSPFTHPPSPPPPHPIPTHCLESSTPVCEITSTYGPIFSTQVLFLLFAFSPYLVVSDRDLQPLNEHATDNTRSPSGHGQIKGATVAFRGLSMPAETRICSCCIYYMQKSTSSFESCQSGYRKIKHTRELISARKTSHKHNNKDPSREDLPMVEFMYLVFTRMQGESYRMRLRSLLCLCDVFRALINSLVY